MKRGKYIVIEGPDGTSKTTQAHLLVDAFIERGIDSQYIHEPGETALGYELEKLIKDRSVTRTALTDLLLFTANRVEVYTQIIKPALELGKVIVADRNWLSSIAYQGVAQQLGIDIVLEETRRHLSKEYLHPTATILLHTSDSQRVTMLNQRGTSINDLFESRSDSFQRAVLRGYEEAGKLIGSYTPISAAGTPNEVHARIVKKLATKSSNQRFWQFIIDILCIIGRRNRS